jgi:hypothetical protein
MTARRNAIKGCSRNTLDGYALVCRKTQQGLSALIPPAGL